MKTLLFLAWIGSCSADATTTHLALNRGAHEVVISQSPIADDAILGGLGIAGGLGARKLYQKHPKLAILITAVGVSIHTWAAIHNSQVPGRR